MQRFTKFLLFLPLIFLIGCEGPAGTQGPEGPEGPTGDPGTSDKQIRFEFDDSTIFSTPGTTLDDRIIKFNINNYANVDSAIFVAEIASVEGEIAATAKLINSTDQQILGTTETTSTDLSLTETENIISNFADKEITLSVRLEPESEGGNVRVGDEIVLFLYR